MEYDELTIQTIVWLTSLTRLHRSCSIVADDEATTDGAPLAPFGPFAIIVAAVWATESWMGFIGGGSSNVFSSSGSRSWCADCELGNALRASFVCFSVGSLKVLSEDFLTSGRSTAGLLSTLPWESLRSGIGNHFRLKVKCIYVLNNKVYMMNLNLNEHCWTLMYNIYKYPIPNA